MSMTRPLLHLAIQSGPRAGETFAATKYPVRIGRDADCSLHLDDARVSRLHAAIEQDEWGGWVLHDLQSTNSTYVNGTAVQTAVLKEGDAIRIGSSEMIVLACAAEAAGANSFELATDPASIERALRTSSAPEAKGSQLQEALFRIGLLAEPATSPDLFLDRAIEVVQWCVPFDTWAWLDWPEGTSRSPRVRGYRGAAPIDLESLRPSLPFVERTLARRAGIIGHGGPSGEHEISGRQIFPAGLSALAIPIARPSSSRALLYVERLGEPALARSDLERLAALATQIDLDLSNLSLHQRLQAALDEVRQSQTELVRSEKLAAIGRLASSFAHDLNNPLGSIIGFLELAIRSLEGAQAGALPPKLALYLERANTAADYCRALSRNLLAFARMTPEESSRSTPFDVREKIEATMSFWGSNLNKKKIVLELDIPSGILLYGDPSTLQQVVMNLVTNAEDALCEMPPAHARVIRIFGEPKKDGVSLTVEDNGPGIPKEIREKIFEPLFTTKKGNHGTGLGLYVVRRIVQESGGSISLESTVGSGTSFTVYLPSRVQKLGAEQEQATLVDIRLEELGGQLA